MATSGVDDRRIAVLRRVIEHYVSTGQPVGSNHVASLPGVSVSPATIRNDMAALEADGFLVQPHTSAGCVPTDKGYRLYVDHLTSTDVAKAGRLSAVSSQRLGDFFDSAHVRLEETLHRTSLLLAQLTNYTAVVTGPSVSEAVVRSAHVVSLNDRVGTVVAVLSNGDIESEQIDFATPPSEMHIALANARLNETLVGKTLGLAPFEPRHGGSDAGVDAEVEALVGRAVAAV